MTEYLLTKVIRIMPIDFINLLDVKYIFNLSCTCKYLQNELKSIYKNILYPNVNYEIFYKDAFGRSFNNEIPNLGITALKYLPSSNVSIQKYCNYNSYKEDLLSIDNHLILAIDKSGSTSTFCCNIEEGEFIGTKSVLDVIKMFTTTIIDIIKINPDLNIKKVSIISFDSLITEYYNFNSVDTLDYSKLSKIRSSGGTDFNGMISYVKDNLCKYKSINHKLLVLTDCSCLVDSNRIVELLKANCNINTCFVPPGSPSTLNVIREYCMDSGLHQELSINFHNPNTIDTWCDFIGDVLSLQQVSLVEIKNKDSTKSIYTTNDCKDYIDESIRPIYNVDFIFSKSLLFCYDFSGVHQHILKNKVSDKKMTHHVFGICLKKICNSFNEKFISLTNNITEYQKIKSQINSCNESINLFKKEINFLIREKFIKNNKEKFLKSIKEIISYYKRYKFRKHLKKMIDNKCVVKSIYAFKMQQIFKKNKDNFNYRPFNGFGIRRSLINPNFSNFGMHKITSNYEDIDNRIFYLLKNTKIKYTLIDELNEKIKLHDMDKNKAKILSLIGKYNNIKKIIIDGIIENIDIKKITNIPIKIDKIDFNNTSFIFSKDIFKIFIPIQKIDEYSIYHKVLLHIDENINKISNFLKNYNPYNKLNVLCSNSYDYDSPYQINNMYVPKIENFDNKCFRECSVPYDRTPLSRQVSDSIRTSTVAKALRSVSTHR